MTDEPLQQDDLLALSTSKAIRPRPVPATSVPSLLSLLQDEWDATVLETHQLRRSLHAARQELSHALYQHDAATRVIARLIRERDSFRDRLEHTTAAVALDAGPSAAAANGKRPISESEAGPSATEAGAEPAGKRPRPALGSTVIDAMTACSTELSQKRKKRVVSPTVATPDDIAAFVLAGSHPLHATRKGGILAVAVLDSVESSGIVATAGADSTIQIFDRTEARTLASLKGHSKKVLDVTFVGGRATVASASADKTVRLWKAASDDDNSSGYECSAVLTDQDGEVVSVNAHPTGNYVISAASDGTWCFYDVSRAECLARVTSEEEENNTHKAYSAAALHPDGLILCTGDSGAGIQVWETRTQKCVAKFDGHSGAITSLSFSENGYHLASAAADGVKLWDLRKLKNFKSLTPYGEGPKAGVTTAVSFDHSGLFLAVGGHDARVYGAKQDWNVVNEFGDVPKKGVSAVAWGPDARALLVGAADHNLRVFAAPVQ